MVLPVGVNPVLDIHALVGYPGLAKNYGIYHDLLHSRGHMVKFEAKREHCAAIRDHSDLKQFVFGISHGTKIIRTNSTLTTNACHTDIFASI